MIARPRISINENATEVEMNYKQSDSDQVVTMKSKELTLSIFFRSMRPDLVDFQTLSIVLTYILENNLTISLVLYLFRESNWNEVKKDHRQHKSNFL